MKTTILLIILAVFGLKVSAQTPLTEAVDFTAKDVHGNTHHLFQILDEGNQYVLIDFFSVTCGSCQVLAPKMDSVYRYFGENNLDLFVLAIDQTFNNAAVLEFEEEYGTHYPAISGIDGGGGQIFENYQIPYYPSLVLIAPNHEIVEQAIPIPTSAQQLINLMESYGMQGVGIQEEKALLKFNLSPNPVCSFLNIKTPDNKPSSEIVVYSITGEKILSESVSSKNQSSFTLNVEELRQGMYLVSVIYKSGERFSSTFVKN